MLADQLLQHLHRQLLTRFPAIEAVGIVLHEEHQLIAAVRIVQLHRCGEAAQRDGCGRSGTSTKVKLCSASVTASTRLVPWACASPCRRSGKSLPSAASSQLHGNHEWLLGRLARRRRAALAERQAIGLRRLVVLLADRQTRGAGRLYQRLNCDRSAPLASSIALTKSSTVTAAVVALEVQVAALAEAFLAEQRLDHAHHFGTLFVDSQGVVGDLDE